MLMLRRHDVRDCYLESQIVYIIKHLFMNRKEETHKGSNIFANQRRRFYGSHPSLKSNTARPPAARRFSAEQLQSFHLIGPPHPPIRSPRGVCPPSTTMASLHAIPRFLLPRQPLLRPSRFTQSLVLPTSSAVRHVSNARQLSAEFERRRAAAASTKQHVIPQPDKYRAPSHGKTLRRTDSGVGKVYGPKLSDEDRKRMATKKYPNMMSPEGTFSHWFLNNRLIHLWITMVRCGCAHSQV